MDRLIHDAAMRNNVAYYEEKLNKLGISKEEMFDALQMDEERWNERTANPFEIYLLVTAIAAIGIGVIVSIL